MQNDLETYQKYNLMIIHHINSNMDNTEHHEHRSMKIHDDKDRVRHVKKFHKLRRQQSI
ncbi:unnamed protein product [Schistosoma curassoni]|uniref:Ovule protein n=1 Tax=Schistosoma curassoni TaxID=6186 RepID=A0A183JN75_9TREM|nr:unnamed protein product [Schistosoma curassoni]